ncbi:BTAD domain-containing putative transcriptional regulator [Kribbella sp. NPDC023972]|uniref:BTAD domain-containing putative transcriptional regulator n=1 Tax=Kribbella sp. NPDC023972 TaxID=3154795 RepID=UPI0033C90247
MEIAVLGACRAIEPARDGGPARVVALGARKPRSVLAALTLHLGYDVSPDLLVDLVWSGEAPAGAHGTLHSYISGLRRALEPDLGPRGRPTVLVTTDHGYQLALPHRDVDAYRFRDEVRSTHRALAPLTSQLAVASADGWPDRDDIAAGVERLEQALGWWTGEAFADLGGHPDVLAQRAALEELRLTAEEDRVLGLLALGDHATVVAITEQSTARHPLRERIWGLHALALARCGRQAEALAALRQVRGVLADELGIDPSQELRTLEHAILVQDQRLKPPTPERRSALAGVTTAEAAPVTGAWETVGREAETAALAHLLDRSTAGQPAAALLVGEAGIGKSRLVDQLLTEARRRGMAVAIGRGSQDDGAPPLWPWRSVLDDLARSGGAYAVPDLDAAAGFRTWEAVAAAVIRRSAETPILVVLEDLHWADTASLRTLTHLVRTAGPGDRVAVVATRRPWPEPTGALAEVGEAMARRHATRIDLTGLSFEDARRLVSAVSGQETPPRDVRAWHDRAGGNPFFLVELARSGDVASVPATVRDVLLRRLEALPNASRDTLVLAAVLGRTFSVDLLAVVNDRTADDVDDLLEPARAAGLIVDDRAGIMSFTHALTRDAVASSVRSTRLARLHGQTAHALENRSEVAQLLRREELIAEVARHWLEAGPLYVGRAWRTAVAAAEQSRRVFSHEEAAELMRAAVEAHRRDPAGTAEERHALLLARAGDCQRMADWYAVVDCAVEAIALARSTSDPHRLAEAAAEMTRHCLWVPHDWNVVLEDVIDDLRWALAVLPPTDSIARCRAMLALAVELYYERNAHAELCALVDEGVAMARRIGDPELLWWATRAGWMALWLPSRLADRELLGRESLAVAEQLDDPDVLALSHAIVACGALERGDPHGWRVHAAAAERLARRRRLAFVSYVLGFVDVTLAGLRGDVARAQTGADLLRELRYQIHLPAQDGHEAGIALATGYWMPELLEPFVDPMAAAMDATDLDIGLTVVYVALARVGRIDEARRRLRDRPIAIQNEYWSTSMDAALLAELAVHAREPHLARRARDVLRPLSGRMSVSGFSVTIGPIDGYLALAEVVGGDRSMATEYADRAVQQASTWDFPLYLSWLERHREALEF